MTQGETQLASLITFTAGECVGGEGRGGKGEREQTRPCTRCSLHACSLTLCLSFSCLRSAVEASFDTRKAHGKPYSREITVIVETNVMIGNKCLGPNVIMREQMLSFGNHCYHVTNNRLWQQILFQGEANVIMG